MAEPARERRRYKRKDDRAEMAMGSGRAPVSNLSLEGAFVSILSGLQPDDSFSFELTLDGQEEAPVSGRAIVRWTDPGVGVGVRIQLSDNQRSRLASYLERLEGEEGVSRTDPQPGYETPRRSRRTIAIGSGDPNEGTRVWIRYSPDDESSD